MNESSLSFIQNDLGISTANHESEESPITFNNFSFTDGFLNDPSKFDIDENSTSVVSLIENRTREVFLIILNFKIVLIIFEKIGVAAYEEYFAQVTLMEYSDSQTYSSTVMHLSVFNPSEVFFFSYYFFS